jgi:putative sterol carrier protein
METMDEAVAAINAKLGSANIGGTAKFDITGHGSVLVDDNGAREGDAPADVTLTADADTFQEILRGDLNPTSAFMTGRLKIDGDMGMAMKLASAMA